MSPDRISRMKSSANNRVNADAFFVRVAHYKCAGYASRRYAQ